jgi:caffeoyl-CoA O-methyltransferase
LNVDADKGGYINYYELIMKHDMLSDHGVIVADNGNLFYHDWLRPKKKVLNIQSIIVLYFGQVHKQTATYKEDSNNNIAAEASKNIRKTAAKVHAFNQHVYRDPRVEVVILPVFDGISLIRKQAAE